MRNYRERFLHILRALFRTSLLITGSIESAECALIEAIGVLSEFEPSGVVFTCDAIGFAVARKSVEILHPPKLASDSVTESVLMLVHEELRPVFDLPRDLRCCFVLRTLAGYTREQVGLLMNIPSEDVEVLTQSAVVRFAALASKRGQEMAAFAPTSRLPQDPNPIESAI